MRCPDCSSEKSRVIDKRDVDDITRRRRMCLRCENKFTTYEKVGKELIVKKKDNSEEPFQREKVRKGINIACEKRPISEKDIEKIVSFVEAKFKNRNKVTTREVGETITGKLKDIDKVAYLRFASVYRPFKDIKSFEKELKALAKE